MPQATVQDANAALHLLCIFIAVSMMLGGVRGRQWAIRLVLAPIRAILAIFERRIQAAVTILVLTVLSGYGILTLIIRLLK